MNLIVLHTAEGARTIESLGNFFSNPGAQASSHAGADDKVNTVGEYVARPDKAWTQANANPYCVSIELCGFASWSTAEWDQHPNMLDNCAKWIAEEAVAFNIPVRRLNAGQAQSGSRGVCQHVDLGAAGGGHWDCGDGFPMDRVINMALGGPAPVPEPEPEDEDVANYTICAAHGDGNQYVTDLVSTKRLITNTDDWNSTVWCLIASGAKLYYQDVNNPIRVPATLLAELPEAKA